MNNHSSFSRRRFLSAGSISLAGIWSAASAQLSGGLVRGLVAEASRAVRAPRFVPTPQSWDPQGITAAWLGHSTVLVNFYGLHLLTDPALFRRIGADTCFGTVGVKRLVAPALRPWQLPPIDLVLLSHAHMDHFDKATLRCLPGAPQVVTAHDTAELLPRNRRRKATALSWGGKARITTRKGEVRVRAFEVKHWGARWRYDSHRGYNGYVLEREGKRLLFGGDTAWSSSFRGLRRRGPFELAIMPIGAYQPWVCSHCTPEQAVRMANDAGAKYLLPIHFKTFPLGREGSLEPAQRLQAAIEPERIALRDVGQTFRLC